jgi:hypothetical protein
MKSALSSVAEPLPGVRPVLPIQNQNHIGASGLAAVMFQH